MADNCDLLRIYYNLFADNQTFTDTLHMINGDQYWDRRSSMTLRHSATDLPQTSVHVLPIHQCGSPDDTNIHNEPKCYDND